jgi:enoyl-CoA hydratase
MPPTYHTLRVEKPRTYVGLLTLNRPQIANAINTQMAQELLRFFIELAADPAELRCLLITGAGEKTFCAGADLKERNGMTNEAWKAQHEIIERMIPMILECPVPVIAVVNGAAFGGGCEIAMASDFVFAAETARFALTETSLGIIPGAGGTQTLPRAVGTRRAMELICTAAPFSAQEAVAWGLVNRVVPNGQLLSESLSTAEKIASNAPLAVRLAKKSIQTGAQMGMHYGLQFSVMAYNQLVGTDDRLEGVQSFVEKRKPTFHGR